MATSQANRGKSLEQRFKALCGVKEAKASFSSYRFPDAHSGSRAVVPADMMTMWDGQLHMVELKEVAHATRLPYKNFRPDQVARMRKWQLAGAKSLVLIHHTAADVYRVLPVDYFLDRPEGQASWQLGEDGHLFKLLENAFNFIHGQPYGNLSNQ